MALSVGLRLISSILNNCSVKQFSKLNIKPEHLKPAELECYEFIQKFIYKHKSVPKKETVLSELGDVSLPLAKEVPSYYANQVQERYISDNIKKGFEKIKIHLQKETLDVDKGIQELTSTLMTVSKAKNAHHMVDFKEAGEFIAKAYKEKKVQGMDGRVLMGYPSVDVSAGGMTGGDSVAIVGRPACKAGITRVYISRRKRGAGRYYTLAELYRGFHGKKAKQGRGAKYWDLSIPTRVRSLMDNDLTGLNIIEDVLSCGVKKTYTITTESGKQERATLDHLYLTEVGFTALGDLQKGMMVICESDNVASSTIYKAPYRKEICTKLKYSPYPTRVINGCTYHRVMEQRASYDAALNGIALNEFIEQLRTNKNHGFTFSNPKKHIHHKDTISKNNDEGNLELLTNSEHNKVHDVSGSNRKRLGRNNVQSEIIVSIEYYGEEETYDIVCADPYNNFISEGFVTHNSGKTFHTLNIARNAWFEQKKTVLYVTMEMNILSIQERLISMHTKHNLTQLKKAQLSTKAYNAMLTQLALNQDEEQSLWIVDGSLTATVEDIWKLCMQVDPDFVVVDGAYLLKHPNIRMGKYERIAENAELLKQMIANDINIPCLNSWQFNRDATKKMEKNKNAKAGLEDIGSTDVIGQISSIVLGFTQEESVETLITRKVEILKGRNGETGSFMVNWDFVNMDFSEIVENEWVAGQYEEMHELIIK